MTAADRATSEARRVIARKLRGEAVPDAEWLPAMQAAVDAVDWVNAGKRRIAA